jgi:hypothetical protein
VVFTSSAVVTATKNGDVSALSQQDAATTVRCNNSTMQQQYDATTVSFMKSASIDTGIGELLTG